MHTFSETFIVKPFKKGMKISRKNFQKYKKTRQRFEQKWLKKNAAWKDTRQKKKALLKEFVKTFPQYKSYIQLERLGQKCKKY